ncbi:MAG: acyl-CoA thioesterase [Gammaproteobacteria bacterium]|nr:acyl-CoA thioesterase [Gammaproteobacteria bacterium]
MTKCDVSLSADVEIEIPFEDGDPMGVTWHGNYFRYLERARCRLLDKIGYGYRAMLESGYSWPIVDTRVKFIRPTEFQQRIRIVANLEEYENRLKLGYEITELESGERTTKGYTIQVAIDNATGELCFVSPPILVEKIRACA